MISENSKKENIKDRKGIKCLYCGGSDFKEGDFKEIQFYKCSNPKCSHNNTNVAISQLRLNHNLWQKAQIEFLNTWQKELIEELKNIKDDEDEQVHLNSVLYKIGEKLKVIKSE